MSEEHIFAISLLVYGFILILFAFFTWKTNPDNISIREKACREKLSGTAMTFVALIWCAKHGQEIFPGEKISSYFMPLALIMTWCAYFLLDFLPARAIAALSILIAHYHLYWLFALHSPISPILAIACFITGTAGIFISGKPCLLRDFFRASARKKLFPKIAVSVITILGVMYFIAGVYYLINK